ncbi:hypothetical protein IFR05_017569, partial [Cadophora sp. M221]
MASLLAGKPENNSRAKQQRAFVDKPPASTTKTRTSGLTVDQAQLIEDILTGAFIDDVRWFLSDSAIAK